MHPTVVVKRNLFTDRTQVTAQAQRIITSFANELPDLKLLCFFDDEDWQPFKESNGVENRGFYQVLREGALPDWPDYLRREIFVPMLAPKLAFHNVIYLHGSTCSNEVGLTMTLAHELQHFVQYGISLNLWAANTLATAVVTRLAKSDIELLGLTWCTLPHEREARIVSKRIAEELFGTDVVRQYIEAKIAERVTQEDADDWECIRRLVTSTQYNLAAETKMFFPRLKAYRRQLENALLEFRGNDDPDFNDIDLDGLLNGSDA